MSLSRRIAQLFRRDLSQLSSKVVSSKDIVLTGDLDEEGKGD